MGMQIKELLFGDRLWDLHMTSNFLEGPLCTNWDSFDILIPAIRGSCHGEELKILFPIFNSLATWNFVTALKNEKVRLCRPRSSKENCNSNLDVYIVCKLQMHMHLLIPHSKPVNE